MKLQKLKKGTIFSNAKLSALRAILLTIRLFLADVDFVNKFSESQFISCSVVQFCSQLSFFSNVALSVDCYILVFESFSSFLIFFFLRFFPLLYLKIAENIYEKKKVDHFVPKELIFR